MAEFREISESEWDRLPPPKPAKPPNPWDELLGAVASGKIVVIDVPEGKLRGTRIGLARSASSRGMKLEFRAQDGHLAIRRSQQPISPAGQSQRKGRTPRSRAGESPKETQADPREASRE